MSSRLNLFYKLMVIMTITAMLVAGCASQTPAPAEPPAEATEAPVVAEAPAVTEAPAATQAPAERTKLQVASWWDFNTTTALQELKTQFEAKNPDLELEFVQIASKDYADKILTMIAGGGDVPDVMMIAMDKLPMFADRGAITNLDQYYTEELKADMYPVALNALKYQDSFYAVPRTVTTQVMYLNKAMFEAANVTYPSDDWTWKEFLDIAKQLSKTDDNGQPIQWGFYFPKWNDGFYQFLRQNDGGLVSEDGTKSMLSDPNSVEALHFLQDMIVKDKVVPTETQAQQFGNDDVAPFIAGKVAMLVGGISWQASLDEAKVEYDMVPLPAGKRKMNTSFVNAWAIPKGAKNPDLSWRVLEFFGGKDGQQIVLDQALGLPASKGVDTTAFLAKHPDNHYFIYAMADADPFPTPLHGVDFFNLVEKEFDLMWSGQISVEDAVAAVEKTGNDILAGNQP